MIFSGFRGLFPCALIAILLSFCLSASGQDNGDEIVILVADFQGSGDPSVLPSGHYAVPLTESLFSWFTSISNRNGGFRTIRLNQIDETAGRVEENFDQLEENGVDFVVYGTYELTATGVDVEMSAINLSGQYAGQIIYMHSDDDNDFSISELVPGTDPPDVVTLMANTLVSYAYISQGHVDESIEYLERVAGLGEAIPGQIAALAYSVRSMTSLAAGDTVSALEDADLAMELDPQNYAYYILKGSILEEAGETEAALEVYLCADDIRNQNPENLYNMSRMYLELDDYENALKNIDEAIQLVPDEPRYLNFLGYIHNYSGEYSAAVDVISRALELDPEYAIGWANLACAQRDMGNTEEAIESFTCAVNCQEDPLLSGSYMVDRGYCYSLIDDYQSAVDDYVAGLALTAGNASNYGYLGWLQTQTGDYSGALISLNTALDLDPGNTDCLRNRAFCYYNTGNLQAAIEDYTEVLRLDPEDISSYEYLGKSFADMGDAASAIRCFTIGANLSEIPAEKAWLISYRAICYQDVGDLASALFDFIRAVELIPEEPYMYFKLGEIYYLMDRDSEAIECFNLSIEKNLDIDYLPGCLFERGRSLLILGDFEQAIKDFNEAISILPEYYDVYYFRGKAYYEIGEFDLCKEDMNNYLAVGSDGQYLMHAAQYLRQIEHLMR